MEFWEVNPFTEQDVAGSLVNGVAVWSIRLAGEGLSLPGALWSGCQREAGPLLPGSLSESSCLVLALLYDCITAPLSSFTILLQFFVAVCVFGLSQSKDSMCDLLLVRHLQH